MLLKEICVENFERLSKIIEEADRIELCDNLAEGGTSVSIGVAKEALVISKKHEVPVMAMVRPRKGNFVFSEAELRSMLTDVAAYRELGMDGIVFGCLTADNNLDLAANQAIISAAQGASLTFHMAFDELNEPLAAIDWLAEQGVHRILTHGGPLHTAISDNYDRLRQYQEYAGNRLIILPGGGITTENMASVAENLDVQEVHGTRLV